MERFEIEPSLAPAESRPLCPALPRSGPHWSRRNQRRAPLARPRPFTAPTLASSSAVDSAGVHAATGAAARRRATRGARADRGEARAKAIEGREGGGESARWG